MKLACSNCQTNYRIAGEKIPPGGARANCPNCGQTMIIPGTGAGEGSDSALMGRSGADYGQTMAYDFSEVDQSQTEVSAFLERISEREPFIQEGLVLSLKDLQTCEEYRLPAAQLTVGRKGVDINVDDPEVSRKHCLIKVFGDHIVVMDLQSTNGTRVHGKKVMTAGIRTGEQFVIGNTTLELVAKKLD